MKKWILPLILIMTFTLTVNVFATEQRALRLTPSLSIDGTVATCKVTVSEQGKDIEVTMELWSGSTLINSWDKTGNSVVLLSESCKVTKGKTYTLKTYGTVDGVSFTGRTVTGTC